MTRSVVTTLGCVAVLVVPACSGGDGDEPSEGPPATRTSSPASGGPSSPDPYSDRAQAIGFDKIPIDGVAGSSLEWRLTAPTVDGSPVSVTQRFLVLQSLAEVPGGGLDPALASTVSTGGQLAATRNLLLGRSQGQDESGPLWIWLDTAEESGERAEVRGCADVGWFQPSGSPKPAPVDRRAEAWRTELERVDDADGGEVWKVSRYSRGPVNEAHPFESRCPAWADHTP